MTLMTVKLNLIMRKGKRGRDSKMNEEEQRECNLIVFYFLLSHTTKLYTILVHGLLNEVVEGDGLVPV